MSFLSSDQDARIRFAYRVYSTGSTHGASASTVRAAWELIDKIDFQQRLEGPASFKRAAAKILNATENN